MPAKSTGWQRARALYPVAGVTCERCAQRPAEVVHHKDGDPNNNRRRNVERLCRRCHQRGHRFRLVCPHGHLLWGRNVYVDPTGRRRCRACRRQRDRLVKT